MSAVVDYIVAVREIARAKAEKRKKDAMYRTLVGTPLNFMIIKDLVNAAVHDVVIDITFKSKDGETARLQIRREQSKIEAPPESDLFV